MSFAHREHEARQEHIRFTFTTFPTLIRPARPILWNGTRTIMLTTTATGASRFNTGLAILSILAEKWGRWTSDLTEVIGKWQQSF